MGKKAVPWTITNNNLKGFFLDICCNFVTCIGEQKLFVVEMKAEEKEVVRNCMKYNQ